MPERENNNVVLCFDYGKELVRCKTEFGHILDKYNPGLRRIIINRLSVLAEHDNIALESRIYRKFLRVGLRKMEI